MRRSGTFWGKEVEIVKRVLKPVKIDKIEKCTATLIFSKFDSMNSTNEPCPILFYGICTLFLQYVLNGHRNEMSCSAGELLLYLPHHMFIKVHFN